MLTGISSSAYFGLKDYDSGLRKMKEHGYDCTDYRGLMSKASELYCLKEGAFEHYFSELKQCADDIGIKIFQMHALWGTIDDTTEQGRQATAEYFLKDIEAASLMECRYLVLHPCIPCGWGVEENRNAAFEKTVEWLEKLLPRARKANVVLCVENMPFPAGHSFSEIGELKKLVRFMNDDNVKACFDTGHSYVTDECSYDCIKMLGEDLAVLHVHDDSNRTDRHLIPFQGGIDWDGFIRGLREIGYNGCLNLETSVSKRMPQPMQEQMQKALAGIARWFATQISE